VIHAASCNWEADRSASGGEAAPEADLRYYSRGVFAWPQITSDWALGGRGFVGKLKVRGWRWGGGGVGWGGCRRV